MPDPFAVEVASRGYEVDANGHIAGVVLLQYAQHARWECLRAAGVAPTDYARLGVSPVSLEERIRFRRELLAGEAITISCEFAWPEGKTFTVTQELRHSDGGLVAEVENVGGLMHLATRRLLLDPAAHMGTIASAPELLGLRPGRPAESADGGP